MNEQINVTKAYLPPEAEYRELLKGVWSRCQLTNQGPLVRELEARLRSTLGVEYFHYLANGTLALQLALRALEITEGEVITTPFSYVATTSAILWENCTPVFADIDPQTLCIAPEKIESLITPRTRAILPVHVFGAPCDTDAIAAVAKKHNLKVIYDGAHAFGSLYRGRSLLSYGDIATCSFHATKLFHTVEGGACIVRDQEVSERLELQKRFGHQGDEHFMLGINAKASELHAAMGLCNLPHLPEIITTRKHLSELYDRELGDSIRRPERPADLSYNYAYYPVIFHSETELKEVFAILAQENIFPRRYFYPALNTLPYLSHAERCPVAEDISRRIACLPLYAGLSDENVGRIAALIRSALR